MKNCIIYTVKNDPSHFTKLEISLNYLLDNVIPFSLFDILFFCDPGADIAVQVYIRKLGITNNVFIIPFNTKPPAGYEKTPMVQYKNMCCFWAGEVFRHPKVKEYDYYMRLDCDSYITSTVKYDLFEMMKAEGKDYAFTKGGMFMDTAPYYEGINNALREFEAQFPEIMKNPVSALREGLLYYTNFEICRVKAFSESLYMNLFDHIVRVQGIYKHRWGDHIIRYAGIHMLLGFDRVKEIVDMDYTHQFFVNGIMGG